MQKQFACSMLKKKESIARTNERTSFFKSGPESRELTIGDCYTLAGLFADLAKNIKDISYSTESPSGRTTQGLLMDLLGGRVTKFDVLSKIGHIEDYLGMVKGLVESDRLKDYKK